MPEWRVHVTRPIPEGGLEVLKEAGLHPSVPGFEGLPPREELLAAVTGVDGILTLLTERIDGPVMDRAPQLRVVANMAVGFDNIDVGEATRRGIAVCNTPGVLTETTADFTWALLLAVARRVAEGDRRVREGGFDAWGPLMLLGADVHGATLGIVGFGRIGQAVARRAVGFGMNVLYCSPSAVPGDARQVDLETLLVESNFVTLHVPLKPDTHHLIGPAQLALMRNDACLVNTSRGPVVDEAALVAALRDGRIAGAALDVYEREPALAEGLAEFPRVVLAPHIASASVATRDRMARMAARNLVQVLQGKRPDHCVNREVLEENHG